MKKKENPSQKEKKERKQKRKTVEKNIQYDTETKKYIVEFYYGIVEGKTQRRHRSFDTLKEAQRALALFQAEKAKGLPQNAGSKITFGECMEEYLERAQLAETTKSGYRVIMSRIAKRRLYWERVADVRRVEVEDYLQAMRETGEYKNATINKDLDFIRVVLKYAVHREYIATNPVDHIQKLKTEKFDPECLTREEAKKIVAKAREQYDDILYVSICLALLQGMRRGEIAGLRWENVLLEENIIRIRETATQVGGTRVRKPPKTQASNRDVEIHPYVKKVLLKLKDEQRRNRVFGGYVVLNPWGDNVSPVTISMKFRKFMNKNGFGNIRFHDLRHSYATISIGLGANPLDVCGAMGHASLATTYKYYVHSKSRSGSQSVNKVFTV